MESPDILAIGMLADALRRRVSGTQVTYVRVALVDLTRAGEEEALPESAREVRLSGSPSSLDEALRSVGAVRARAGARVVSGFSWLDLGAWSGIGGGLSRVLTALRGAGLDALAELPLDRVADLPDALGALSDAGLTGIRLTVASAAPAVERSRLFLDTAPLVAPFSNVAAVAPLPMTFNPLRPTTGYDDVKAVALARLAMPAIPHVQVDWLRYGPKLAQVALTFGADDVDNVSPSDEQPDGRRRAPLEELRRNIESAGFTAVERDGRFVPLD
jgi:hypothetical protein